MKPTASVINAARGELIDQGALLTALDSGKIAKAALDVLHSTAMAASVLNNLEIILTPHSAWLSEEASAVVERLGKCECSSRLK